MKQKDVILVFIILLFTSGYFYQDPEWNGNSRLGLTFAMVHEGSFSIDNYHNRRGTDTEDKSLYNGHYYSDKAPGSSFIAAFFYAPIYFTAKIFSLNLNLFIIKQVLTFLSVSLLFALSGVFIYVMCLKMNVNKFQSYLITLSVSLGTMCFPYSVVFYGHQIAASLLIISFYMLFKLKTNPDIYKKYYYFFLLGLLLGFIFIVEYTTMIIIIMIVSYGIYNFLHGNNKTKPSKIITHFLGGVTIPFLIFVVYNTVCFGSPFSTGYNNLENPYFREHISNGIMGISLPNLKVLYYITIHPYMGIFWQSPVLLLSVIGFYLIFRYRKDMSVEAVFSLCAFIFYLFLNAGYSMWWGGAAFGPRHIIPAIMFLFIPLAFLPKKYTALLFILFIISFSQMFIVAASNVHARNVNIQTLSEQTYFSYSNIYNDCFNQLMINNFSWNKGYFLGLEGWLSFEPFFFVFILLNYLFLKNIIKTKEGQKHER